MTASGFGYLTIGKCSAVYGADSVFAMLTKDDFRKVRGGVRLCFALYLSHA